MKRRLFAGGFTQRIAELLRFRAPSMRDRMRIVDGGGRADSKVVPLRRVEVRTSPEADR